MKLLAIGLAHYPEIRRRAAMLQEVQIKDVPSRCIENFALPYAALTTAVAFSDEQAKVLLIDNMSKWDFGFQDSADHIDCLTTVLTSTVDLRGGEKCNVSTLLKRADGPDVKDARNRIGVRIVRKRNRSKVLFVAHDVTARTILKGTKYEGHAIEQYLMRFPGATKSKSGHRLGGDELIPGIEIPIEAVWDTFGSNAESQEDEEDVGV
jgi:hypothetical protein